MNEWFFAKNGQQNGPVTLEQLQELARSGGLDAKDLVWNSTMKDWMPAGQVEGIFASPAPDQPAAPPADPSNPYAAPQSSWTEPAPAAGSALDEIAPGSEPIDPMACVKRGFELTKRNFANILLVGVVYFAILFGLQIVTSIIQGGMGAASQRHPQPGGEVNVVFVGISIVSSIVFQVISTYLGLGLTRVALNFVTGKAVAVGMLFGEGQKLLRAFGASILFVLMVLIGCLLLLVPGIYLALRYGQFLTAIVDRDMGVFDAFSYSSSITTNNKLQLFVLWILSFLIIIAGMIACGIGLIFAGPVVWLTTVVAYRWMQYGHRAAMDQPGTQTPMLAGL
jgi:uncharacterized membrane protein